MPVHYAGVGLRHGRDPRDRRAATAWRVIEDNAHGLFGTLQAAGRSAPFGAASTLSFHETKNLTCGEGGALVINDPALVERAEILREKGTNRSRFFRGQVDKYTWVDVGSSYLPSDTARRLPVRAARGPRRDPGQARTPIWSRYDAELADWADAHGVRPADRAGRLRAPGAPVLPAAAVARRAPGAHRAPARRGDPGGVPLPAAAPVGSGAAATAAGPGQCPVTEASPIGWCGCRSTTI